MSGNYKSGFRRYKRNLRWKAGQRKKGLDDKVGGNWPILTPQQYTEVPEGEPSQLSLPGMEPEYWNSQDIANNYGMRHYHLQNLLYNTQNWMGFPAPAYYGDDREGLWDRAAVEAYAQGRGWNKVPEGQPNIKEAAGTDPEAWKPEGWNYNLKYQVYADGQPETGYWHDTIEDAQNEAHEVMMSAPDSKIEIVGDNGYRQPYPGDLYGYQ